MKWRLHYNPNNAAKHNEGSNRRSSFFKQHNMAFGERGSYYIVNIFLIEGEGKNN